jgi:hypothetical protein
MTNEELLKQIGKLLTPFIADVAHIRSNVSHIKTAVEAIGAGQEDLREEVKTMKKNMATKADVQDIKFELVKHQRRIENVEENTNTPNPHKN